MANGQTKKLSSLGGLGELRNLPLDHRTTVYTWLGTDLDHILRLGTV
jgi:hypothetical protein